MEFVPLIGMALWALIPGFIAHKKGRSFLGYFVLSFLISPLITMIIALCVSKKTDEYYYEQSVNINNDFGNKKTETIEVNPKKKLDEVDCDIGKELLEKNERILYCRKCGDKLIENSRFCRKCGTEVVKE